MKEKPSHALLFSGGGTRGAYQIGVWEALEHLGANITTVSGVSVGGLNAAFAAMKDIAAAKDLWITTDFSRMFSINMEHVKNIKNRLLQAPFAFKTLDWIGIIDWAMSVANELQGKGIIDIEQFKQLIRDNIDIGLIQKNRIHCYITYKKNNQLTFTDLSNPTDKNENYYDILIGGCMVDYLFPTIHDSQDEYSHAPLSFIPVEPLSVHPPDIVWVVHLSTKTSPLTNLGKTFTFNIYASSLFEKNLTAGFLAMDSKEISQWIQDGFTDTLKYINDIKKKTELFSMNEWIIGENHHKIIKIINQLQNAEHRQGQLQTLKETTSTLINNF